ncbi:hypothetical protein IKH83_02140 [Candidatus Saccharibacteria bacterium]|nr:hypothetical protein [Candidatus Saccharibacteria bacterium]
MGALSEAEREERTMVERFLRQISTGRLARLKKEVILVAAKKKTRAYFDEDGRLIVIQMVDGCLSCPFKEEHAICTPDPFEHTEGLYCSLKKEEHPYPGAETDKKKIFEYDSPSEEKKFENYIPDWCPFRKQKE